MLIGLILATAFSGTDSLRCSISADRIEIALPADMDPKIGSMAIVHGKRWLTVVDDKHRLAPFKPGVRSLTLNVSSQMAIRTTPSGQEESVRAFAKPGAYRIVFSDNLETEPENMNLRDCVVKVSRHSASSARHIP